MSSFRWYEENEVIGKTIIEEDDLTLLEAGKIYIDAIFCERIRFPVQKNEQPIGFNFVYEYNVKKYFGLYDRSFMKIIKQEDLEEYHMRMIDFHVHRLSLGEELDDCPIIGICYGSGPLITPRLEQVYDVSKTKAYRKYRLEKLFD
ncbi:hypothetical protein BCJMU51_p56 (plasmid) [Bacillus cereus]|jgi:hypothetical protein|uniref:Uncharacterized protein n=3 Tax=Bacillus TaxID=1386 RepID=A0ABU8I1I3_9BACI|nr:MULTISPECIES: hypothetical protein [Bacilli]EEL84711.1 hypothetical protein bcere0029_55620 [Bacillus cereus AH1272]EEL90589.1 hypothetical protein bcere0030_54800 [Bacillus cereus AH1273]CJV63898.1 Uncharacterised protein [Streptococcus pneumoniae]HDX9500662.1 hypothetical protein [Bacillus thuringiensis]HDX9643600.1 hypothetical protein [Bacillus mobilis]